MTSPAVTPQSVSTLFTLNTPSKSGQAEGGVTAGLYFIAFICLVVQLPACKGKYRPVITASLFAAARGVGYVFRALAEKHITKGRFEAYLILSSAATFLFIGALGALLSHWFKHCSGKAHFSTTLPHGREMSVLKLMRLLHLVGVAFAIVGAVGADDLFDATTVSTFERGQKLRKISARGFVALMAIYTAFAIGCATLSLFKGPTQASKCPCRTTVIMALTAACLLLLIRSVFALLAVDHYKYSNQPHLLYSLLVLPELLALYIVSIPGFLPAVGSDAENTPGKTLPEDAAAIPVQASSSGAGDSQRVHA